MVKVRDCVHSTKFHTAVGEALTCASAELNVTETSQVGDPPGQIIGASSARCTSCDEPSLIVTLAGVEAIFPPAASTFGVHANAKTAALAAPKTTRQTNTGAFTFMLRTICLFTHLSKPSVHTVEPTNDSDWA